MPPGPALPQGLPGHTGATSPAACLAHERTLTSTPSDHHPSGCTLGRSPPCRPAPAALTQCLHLLRMRVACRRAGVWGRAATADGTRVRGHLSGPRNAAASATERERCMPVRHVQQALLRTPGGEATARPRLLPGFDGRTPAPLVPSGHSVSPRARSSWSTCSCLRLIRCSTKCSSASDRGSSPALGMISCSLAMISRSDSTIPRTASMASVA